MGYVHSLMLAPVLAALAAAEEAVEEAAVLVEEEPPQAASAPAAPEYRQLQEGTAGNAVFHGRFSLFIFFDIGGSYSVLLVAAARVRSRCL